MSAVRPWTDEDVDGLARSSAPNTDWRLASESTRNFYRARARVLLKTLAPRVAELQRAAKVEALRDAARDMNSRYLDCRCDAWVDDRADMIERGERD